MRYAGCLLFLLVACDKPSGGAEPGPPAPTDPPPDEEPIGQPIDEKLMFCPACGRRLPGPTDLPVDLQVKTVYFDSRECLDRFQADPTNRRWVTGLPNQACICTIGQMDDCRCEHCTRNTAPCDCMR